MRSIINAFNRVAENPKVHQITSAAASLALFGAGVSQVATGNLIGGTLLLAGAYIYANLRNEQIQNMEHNRSAPSLGLGR